MLYVTWVWNTCETWSSP